MTIPPETPPVAIEVYALTRAADGSEAFSWIILMVHAIESVMPAETPAGVGSTIRLKTGALVVAANEYEDVSRTLLGDTRLFPENPEIAQAFLDESAKSAEDVDDVEPDAGNVLGFPGSSDGSTDPEDAGFAVAEDDDDLPVIDEFGDDDDDLPF